MKPDSNLEAWTRRELQKLAELTAPATLAPRVLALLQARSSLPWWRQAWWHWPRTPKWTLILFALALAAVFNGGGPLLGDHAASYAGKALDHFSPVTRLQDYFAPLTQSADLLWSSILEPWLLFVVAALAGLYLACLGVGTVFFQVISKRPPQVWNEDIS